MKSNVANRIRNGTSLSKTPGGVTFSSQAPLTPPIKLGTISASIRARIVRSSRR
jgi:hypothetical protein